MIPIRFCVGYFGGKPGKKWFDPRAWKEFASCCGVNLAGAAGGSGLGGWPRLGWRGSAAGLGGWPGWRGWAVVALLPPCRPFRRISAACLKMAIVIAPLIRGISQLIAAASGLLLVFGVVYAMEGMTSRLPMGMAKELAEVTIFMLPWALLSCSGFHDLSNAARRDWIFQAGSMFGLGFLYYLNRHTADSGVAKAAAPVLASAGAIVPHVVRRISFVYSALCVLFALCGIVVLYLDVQTFATGSTFATPVIAVLMVIFPLACITAGVLTVASLIHRGKSQDRPRSM